MSTRKRVVLLAREGAARTRTEAALIEAGAEVALLDPTVDHELDVRGANPDAVLVILDPAVEQVLEKFDGVLGDPAFEVMFEDAELAARREGWEAARWARHLHAKLHGHGNVLPPVPAARAADAAAEGNHANDARFRKEMDDLEMRVAGMAEVPPARATATPSNQGVVLVVAGLGGPDAVRQLLAGLPANFPRAIVLRQRLEGGQYDKLVRQMQRASSMPVLLAQAGDPVNAGNVYVLPEDLGVQAAPVGLVFAPGQPADPFAALPAGESAVLLMSGSDPKLVDAALALSWSGALVMGQAPEGCFDCTASDALVARGGQAQGLATLPLKLLQRWPA